MAKENKNLLIAHINNQQDKLTYEELHDILDHVATIIDGRDKESGKYYMQKN